MEKELHILIVDDDEVDRLAVRRALKKTRTEIKLAQAGDCTQAIAAVKNNNFDCIFLDYYLPDDNGLFLVKQLQSMGITVPTVVLTGQGDEQIAVELMKAGAYDYISKSRISPETLQQALRNALRVYKAEKDAELANHRLRASNELLISKNEELERQQQKIESQNQELQKASRMKSEFMATMSHELRTPMNAVMGFSQMLLLESYGSLTSQQKDMIERIHNNGKNLLLLINEILDFSKIESGHLKLKTETFNLTQLVQLTTEELRSLAMAKDLSFQAEIASDNLEVTNDSACLRRVLVNLISNAVKFTESGEVVVRVWEINSERIAIAVEDTGTGIPEEQLGTIFEAFRQLDQTITRHHPGTGLGLAITDSLVKMMQGSITVKSQVGKGSIFQVEIPRQVPG